jgi:hypothetical protein
MTGLSMTVVSTADSIVVVSTGEVSIPVVSMAVDSTGEVFITVVSMGDCSTTTVGVAIKSSWASEYTLRPLS